MNLFLIRPATRNIGNDLIAYSTERIVSEVFGSLTCIVNIPAMANRQYGGLTSRQIYDINRFADGVIISGGNILENGQITYERVAVNALDRPLMMMACSHGKIATNGHSLQARTDSLSPETLKHIFSFATVSMVRDAATQSALNDLGIATSLGGCPSLFLTPKAQTEAADRLVFVSVRHPSRMSVPAKLQWKIADDVRRLLSTLTQRYGDRVRLLCHDYIDIEFASAFDGIPICYFDDAASYIKALSDCELSIGYRLHAFLPCLAMGRPAIHLSYDERAQSMISSLGLGEWDINCLLPHDYVSIALDRALNFDHYFRSRNLALPIIENMKKMTIEGLRHFKSSILEKPRHG